eukprot:7390889-Prymnesium_polylepis.3
MRLRGAQREGRPSGEASVTTSPRWKWRAIGQAGTYSNVSARSGAHTRCGATIDPLQASWGTARRASKGRPTQGGTERTLQGTYAITSIDSGEIVAAVGVGE